MIAASLLLACVVSAAYGYCRGFREAEEHWRPQYHAVWQRLRAIEGGNDPGPRVRRVK